MAEDDAKPLRVLSAPCSTGQEAYSLAATLWSAGVSSFKIDAFDISRTALAAAQLGVYPAGALDHVPGDLQEACGTFLDQHWHMRDELRGRIRFERRNLAIPGALDNEPGYHLILCRNLFIYLHAEARSALAESLSEALLPGGRLVMGAGDRVAEVNARFTPVGPAASFALIHKVTGARSTTPSAAPGQPLRPRAPRFNSPTPQSELATIPTTSVEFYHRALEYKDRGNMRQAERRCRQALYLAPGYLPALELLQTLWHLHPNAHLRRALKARIERARAEREPYLAAKPPAEEKTP
jgi:chemotaxis protein methyltransferase WspC